MLVGSQSFQSKKGKFILSVKSMRWYLQLLSCIGLLNDISALQSLMIANINLLLFMFITLIKQQ